MSDDRKAPQQGSDHPQRHGSRDSSEFGTHGGPGANRDNKQKQTEPKVTPDSTVHSR